MADFVPYQQSQLSNDEVLERSQQFYELMDRRRTVREFSTDRVPFKLMQNLVTTASSGGVSKAPQFYQTLYKNPKQ